MNEHIEDIDKLKDETKPYWYHDICGWQYFQGNAMLGYVMKPIGGEYHACTESGLYLGKYNTLVEAKRAVDKECEGKS